MRSHAHAYTHTHPTEPQLHIICTAVGFYVGYLAHSYEENSEERTQLLLEKYRHAPREWVQVTSPKDQSGMVI